MEYLSLLLPSFNAHNPSRKLLLRKRVLFIGSFKNKSASGHVGGQMFACNSLVNSRLKDEIDWVLLDTTASTNLKRQFVVRSYYALIRMVKAIFYILFGRVDTVMAFCSSGYSFLEKGTALRIAKFFGKKTILAPRSGFLIDDIVNSASFKSKASQIFDKVDTIICQGSFWKTFFGKELGIGDSKMIVINNWIDSTQYDHSEHSANNPVKILFLGWIESNKGIWDLLEAVKNLKEENFIVQIAGHGKEHEKYSQAIEDNNLHHKMKMMGWTLGEEKIRLLNEADIFVLPSYKEGLPNSMLEAMSSRCAPIISNVGAVSDIVEDGENGFLIEPGDIDQLSNRIKQYLNDSELIKTHSDAAYKTVLEKNSIAYGVSKFKTILT